MSAREQIAAILVRCDRGELSPPVALMEMLIAGESDTLVAEGLRQVEASGAGRTSKPLAALSALFAANGDGCARVAAMLKSDADVPPEGGSFEDGIAFCRRLFDWSVGQSEEASVALYSLGSPEILAQATAEIVVALKAWGCLGEKRRALDLGCGIGRLEPALAAAFAQVDAVDVSPQMIEAARRRQGHLSNVTFTVVSGKNLGAFPSAAYDLVLATDSMPYLVQSGAALVDAHFAEAARLLHPGGHFVILNFSYRANLPHDQHEIESLATKWGFTISMNGEYPFTLWNAPAFLLRKR